MRREMTTPGYRPEGDPTVPFRHEADSLLPLLVGPTHHEQLRERTPISMQDRVDPDALLTPSEVAEMFRVNPKTVTRWVRAGKISAIRTLGGHRRFRAVEIMRYLEQVESEPGF